MSCCTSEHLSSAETARRGMKRIGLQIGSQSDGLLNPEGGLSHNQTSTVSGGGAIIIAVG